MPDEPQGQDATLDQLFPNLAPYLRDNVTPSVNQQTGEVNESVSMEDVDAYMRGKVNPMFRSGVGAPPPQGGWEDGTSGSAQPQTPGQLPTPPPTPPEPTPPSEPPAPLGEATGEENEPLSETPPPPTTPPPPATQDGEQYVQLGDQRVPYSRIQAYLALDQEIQRDERLRNLIAQHFAGEEGRPTHPTTSPASPPPDPFAQVLSEYGDDPAVQAILSAIKTDRESLTSEIARLNGYVQTTYQQTAEQRMRDYEKAVDEGVANFQRNYNLTAEEVAELQSAAAALNVVNALEPKYGPKGAVEKALETAYFMDDKWRSREVARVAQEQRSESTRKQKLAAISGSSGSVPRTTPAPTTPEGNRAAMLEEVANMMSGSWTGDN